MFWIKDNNEFYYDGKYKYDGIASDVEKEFNSMLVADRNGKFKEINDLFYSNMENGINISRFKLYISQTFKELKYRDNPEIVELIR